MAARGAQQSEMPVIGLLHSASPGEWTPYVTAFRNGLKESGLIEGQDVTIEFRWAENRDILRCLHQWTRLTFSVISANAPARGSKVRARARWPTAGQA